MKYVVFLIGHVIAAYATVLVPVTAQAQERARADHEEVVARNRVET